MSLLIPLECQKLPFLRELLGQLWPKQRMGFDDWHPKDMFLPFVAKIFDCLHQQTNDLIHWYANMTWLAKGIGGIPLSILSVVYKQGASNLVKSPSLIHLEVGHCHQWGLLYTWCSFQLPSRSPLFDWFTSHNWWKV